MKQEERRPKRLILMMPAVLLIALLAGPAHAQQSNRQGRLKGEFLNVKVRAFQLRNQTLLDGLWKLARGPAPFGFGFEGVLKKKYKDPDIQKVRFDLDLRNRTVRQILDALCRADPRFRWSRDGATINVFPRATAGDSSYLLNRRLKTFVLRNATDIDAGLLAISRELPPPFEQIAHVQVGGGDPYPPKPWSATFTDLTVREVVNRLAAHGGLCAVWIFRGSQDFRAFGFFNTYLCGKKTPAWIRRIPRPRRKGRQR